MPTSHLLLVLSSFTIILAVDQVCLIMPPALSVLFTFDFVRTGSSLHQPGYVGGGCVGGFWEVLLQALTNSEGGPEVLSVLFTVDFVRAGSSLHFTN